jgi:hypothetical protein
MKWWICEVMSKSEKAVIFRYIAQTRQSFYVLSRVSLSVLGPGPSSRRQQEALRNEPSGATQRRSSGLLLGGVPPLGSSRAWRSSRRPAPLSWS